MTPPEPSRPRQPAAFQWLMQLVALLLVLRLAVSERGGWRWAAVGAAVILVGGWLVQAAGWLHRRRSRD